MKKISIGALLLFASAAVWQGCLKSKSEAEVTLAGKAGKIDFNYHVKPILSDKCFACHGPDEKNMYPLPCSH